MRSIHINGFSHRMVHDADGGARRVTVHATAIEIPCTGIWRGAHNRRSAGRGRRCGALHGAIEGGGIGGPGGPRRAHLHGRHGGTRSHLHPFSPPGMLQLLPRRRRPGRCAGRRPRQAVLRAYCKAARASRAASTMGREASMSRRLGAQATECPRAAWGGGGAQGSGWRPGHGDRPTWQKPGRRAAPRGRRRAGRADRPPGPARGCP